MKTCSKCGQIKEFSEFYKTTKMKCGYFSSCKECIKKRMHEKKENLIMQLESKVKTSIVVENKLLSGVDKKLCGKCHNVFYISDLINGKRCKECNRKHEKEYRDNNKNKMFVINKKSYEKNKEKILSNQKIYRKTEKGKEVKKAEYYKHKEKYIKRHKERYELKKEEIRQKQKIYYENNKEEINQRRKEERNKKKLEKEQQKLSIK